MTSLPPPGTNLFPEDSLEKKCYSIAEKYREYIPIDNDRNRLGFSLYKFMTNEGDNPYVLVKSTKIKLNGITKEELAGKIKKDLEAIVK